MYIIWHSTNNFQASKNQGNEIHNENKTTNRPRFRNYTNGRMNRQDFFRAVQEDKGKHEQMSRRDMKNTFEKIQMKLPKT